MTMNLAHPVYVYNILHTSIYHIFIYIHMERERDDLTAEGPGGWLGGGIYWVVEYIGTKNRRTKTQHTIQSPEYLVLNKDPKD